MSDLPTPSRSHPTLRRPRLTQAGAPLTREVVATDENGQATALSIPAERALTVFVEDVVRHNAIDTIVVSRGGITQMGYDVATHPGLCAIGRVLNRRFLVYTATQRKVWAPGPASPAHSPAP